MLSPAFHAARFSLFAMRHAISMATIYAIFAILYAAFAAIFRVFDYAMLTLCHMLFRCIFAADVDAAIDAMLFHALYAFSPLIMPYAMLMPAFRC